jgi:hypothetical protein
MALPSLTDAQFAAVRDAFDRRSARVREIWTAIERLTSMTTLGEPRMHSAYGRVSRTDPAPGGADVPPVLVTYIAAAYTLRARIFGRQKPCQNRCGTEES